MTPSKGSVITLWILKILIGLVFLAGGGSKLAGLSSMVAVFSKIGFGQGFRIVTGLIEIVGALGLFVPRFTFYAAVLLAVVMIGAIGFHLTTLGGNPTPPILLFVLSALIAWLSRSGRRVEA